jgi:hypothetical protein
VSKFERYSTVDNGKFHQRDNGFSVGHFGSTSHVLYMGCGGKSKYCQHFCSDL